MTNKPRPIYAEDCNYWKTSTIAPDTWIEDAKDLIRGMGGKILADGYANEPARAAYMVKFQFGEDAFVAISLAA